MNCPFGVYLDYLEWNLRYRFPRGKTVVDIGAGHAPLIRADVLCDMFPLDAAERGVASVYMPPGRFVVGDFNHLPFRDKAFDFAFSRATLEHLPDPEAACREIARVARAGVIVVPSSLWERMGGSPQHLWLISQEDGRLLFKRKTEADAALTALIPERIRDSREYEKLFLHFYSDFFLEQRWTDAPRLTVADAGGSGNKEFEKLLIGDQRVPEERLRDFLKSKRGLGRRLRRLILSLIRAIQGGTPVDLLDVVACPVCRSGLSTTDGPELRCESCRLAYPYHEKVPVLLKSQSKPASGAG